MLLFVCVCCCCLLADIGASKGSLNSSRSRRSSAKACRWSWRQEEEGGGMFCAASGSGGMWLVGGPSNCPTGDRSCGRCGPTGPPPRSASVKEEEEKKKKVSSPFVSRSSRPHTHTQTYLPPTPSIIHHPSSYRRRRRRGGGACASWPGRWWWRRVPVAGRGDMIEGRDGCCEFSCEEEEDVEPRPPMSLPPPPPPPVLPSPWGAATPGPAQHMIMMIK